MAEHKKEGGGINSSICILMKTTLGIKQAHFDNIDCAKVIFAIFVVAIHTLQPFTDTLTSEARHIVTALLSIAVPFFFVASGFLLGNKLNSTDREGQLVYLKKWIYRIGRLYLLWTLIYLPYAIYGFSIEDIGFIKSLAIYIRNILLVGENFWSWPLWYLLAMFVAGCIIYLLLRCKVKRTCWYILAVLFAVSGVFIDELRANDWEGINLYYSIFKTTRNGFFIGFPYIALGVFISSHSVRLHQIGLFVLLMIGFAAQLFDIPLSNFVTIYALFVFILGINLPTRTDDLYMNMRLSSSIIYFTHMLWVGLLLLLFPTLLAIPLFVIAVTLSCLTAGVIIQYKEKGAVTLLFR